MRACTPPRFVANLMFQVPVRLELDSLSGVYRRRSMIHESNRQLHNPQKYTTVCRSRFRSFFFFCFCSLPRDYHQLIVSGVFWRGPVGCALLVATTRTTILSLSPSFVGRRHRVLFQSGWAIIFASGYFSDFRWRRVALTYSSCYILMNVFLSSDETWRSKA